MAREIELKPMLHCGECGTIFLKFATVEVIGEVFPVCPNPKCHGPIAYCSPLLNNAIWWLFNHLLTHSGIDEVRRMNLRNIAESQMGPWIDSYRSL